MDVATESPLIPATPDDAVRAVTETRVLSYATLTDLGRTRTRNEDAFAVDAEAGIFVVCDGMGGAAGGDVASQMAADQFLQAAKAYRSDSPQWRLEHAIGEANLAVFRRSQREPELRGMGTTLVALAFDGPRKFAWALNVGDSRCYRMRGAAAEQLTSDHSYVEEQVQLGRMSKDDAALSRLRNIITRAVGSHIDVEPDLHCVEVETGDIFLLCSDGLVRDVPHEEMDAVLANLAGSTEDLHKIAERLIALANDHGGSDNITVAIIRA